MSIYIGCHPIDDLFAAEISLHLCKLGITTARIHDTCTNAYIDNDIVVIILRSEYVCSNAYSDLLGNISKCTVLPILRSPINILDWADNGILNPIIDFSNYSESQFTSGLRQIADILTSQNRIEIQANGNAMAVYKEYLELETLYLLTPAYLLEPTDFGRSSLSQHPIFKLLSMISFEILNGFEYESGGNSHTDALVNIANSRESCIINCGNFDTNLVAGYLATIERHSLNHSTSYTISLFLDVRNWNKESSSAQWLKDKIGVNKAALNDIQISHFTVYAYALEHSKLDPYEFHRSFKQWWNETSPTLSLVVLCSTLPLRSVVARREPKVRKNLWGWTELQQFCSNYPDRAFAKYILTAVDEQNFFVLNPVFTTILLSLNYDDGTNFSERSPKDYFEYFIDNLWGQYKRDDSRAIGDGILKIAAIMTETRKYYLTYEDVLSYIQSNTLLHRYIDVGIFVLKSGQIRFSLSIIQHYFAARALLKFGIPSRLPTLTLNSESARVPQKWDKPLIIASSFCISDKLEKLIRRVADSDPLLAIECLVGAGQNTEIHAYVIEKNLESLVSIGDFRTDFARHLYRFDASTARAILLEALRDGKWEVRQYAYETFIGLEFPLKVGLVESLTDVNEAGRTNLAPVLKRIATDALPTLFHLLHYDDDITRCNAIWALGEIEDKAAVPALVILLNDSNTKVAALAAKTLSKTRDVCALPYLIEYLSHRHTSMRNVVINTITTLFEQHRDEFLKILQQVDISSRRQMVLYLSSSKLTKWKIDLFLELTKDVDVDVRIASIQALAATNDKRVVARFKECLDDMSKSRLNKSSVSEIVSRILSNVPHGENGSTLRVKSSSMNSSQIVKERLLNVKAQHTTAEIIPKNESGSESDVNSEDGYVADILTQLRSRKWDTGNNAAKLLRDYMKKLRSNASSKVINQVLETLNDDDWVIRWTGVESLGWVGNVHVVPHLIQRLSDSNWKIRVAAIRALAEIKDNSAIAGLTKLSTDTNTVVREAAAEALGFLDGKQAVIALEVFAKDTEDFVRLASVESLGRICDKVAMSALLAALNDSSEHVRWAAANGIMGIADSTIVSNITPHLSDVGGPYWEQKRICDVIVDILKKINSDEAKQAIADWQTTQA